MSLLMEFAMFPMDKGESVSEYVSRVARVVNDSGLNYRLGPMGTVVEGETDEVLALLRKCMMEMQTESKRVYATVKLDWRVGREDGLDSKVESVQSRTDESIRT